MDYRNPFVVKTGDHPEPLAKSLKPIGDVRRSDHEFEDVRFGEPEKGLDHAALTPYIKRVLDLFWAHGYDNHIPKDIPSNLYKAIMKFRASLDLYENLVKKPCFQKAELYSRCLSEGPSFTEFIKKCRSTSLRYFATETESDVDMQYVCHTYSGYDSIFHERGLIYWDDRAGVDDIKYSFLSAGEVNEEEMSGLLDTYLDFLKVENGDFYSTSEFDLISGLQPTSMFDPATGKTRLMREFWSPDIDLSEPYLGKRSVTLVHPGSTRDALVGTPSTILKVKILTALARVVSEKSPHSANASGTAASDRYLRVLKRHAFLHLDFKKYGLMFPRRLTNLLIRKLCHIAGMSPDDLVIDDFFIDIDGEVYKSERGSALGWMDALNAIVVSAILFNLSCTRGMDFDFIGFNDDFELSFWDDRDIRTTLLATREALLAEFNYWDIGLSGDKIFGSKSSFFLENYCYFDKYDLDMEKRQLCISGYASSLVATEPVGAKLAFASSWSYVECDYARERCFSTCPIEFNEDEIFMPLQFGGWYSSETSGLDDSLRKVDSKYLLLGVELSKFEAPKYSSSIRKVSKPEVIHHTSIKRCMKAHSSDYFRHVRHDPEKLSDINLGASAAPQYIELLMENYIGRSSHKKDVMIRYAIERSSGVQPPPHV